MSFHLLICGLLALAIPGVTFADPPSGEESSALKNAVIVIIRQAEKPDEGDGLSGDGEARARGYVGFFKNFTIDGRPLKLNYLFAAADSQKNHRSRLTIEPLSAALGIAIDDRFKDKKFQELADEIHARPHGNILICWHHGEIPQLVQALGADPGQLFPKAKWKESVYNMVIELRYDADGHLVEAKRITFENIPAVSGHKT
jgi:hypothetical protein